MQSYVISSRGFKLRNKKQRLYPTTRKERAVAASPFRGDLVPFQGCSKVRHGKG